MKEVAEVARRFQIIVLSDEIYGQLHHAGEHVSIGQFYPEGTVLSSGLSKWCGAGGWRLGTFVFPPDLDWLCDAMAAIASENVHVCQCSNPTCGGNVRFAAVSRSNATCGHARRILAALGRRCTRTLTEAGVRVHAPQGAFLSLPRLLAIQSVDRRSRTCDRCRALRPTALAMRVSRFSRVQRFARPREEFTARLAYIDF